jgi:predicted transcriptional regulator
MIDPTGVSRIRIQRVEARDARRATDLLKVLKDRLLAHEPHYSGIGHWVADKVIPEIKIGRRFGYVGFVGETPILVGVLKGGAKSKFCHLSIETGFQGNKLGNLMFSLMAAEVRRCAKEIHFTLPEGLWEEQKGFFQAFGFVTAERASCQYRAYEEELRCSANFSSVWKHVVGLLPTLLTNVSVSGFQVNDGVVLSVHAKHAQAMMQGNKTVEIRRRFADRWIGRNASIYSAGGSGSLMGTVKIGDAIKGTPNDIWERFHTVIGCSRKEFDDYSGSRPYLWAISLIDPQPYEAPVPLSQLSHLLGETLPVPQSYSAHTSSDAWGKALSLAAMLHGKPRTQRRQPHPQGADAIRVGSLDKEPLDGCSI